MNYRKTNRLKEYDYSQLGWYFVTICTHHMKNHFGEIQDCKMALNPCGVIVDKAWRWLSKQYQYCEIDEYIIMPNHFHGILIIDSLNDVGTTRELSLRQTKIKSLSELIGAFKTRSSKEIHLLGNNNFKWQRSFYDRIIRNEKELFNIRKYIEQNVLKFEIKNAIKNISI